MAEQDKPDSDETNTEEDGPRPARSAKTGFIAVLVASVLLPATAGGWIAYTQYDRLVATAASVGFQIGTKDVDEGKHEAVEYGQFMQIENMIINPAGSSGKRYLLVSLGLESQDPLVLEEIKRKDVVVRDTVLKVLGIRTMDELADINRRNELKHEIRDAINGVLSEGTVSRLYFTQFVLQ
ncbi:MAG TPA: flagellar basal body-associated FliL family protein [Rhodothermales bacterium]|nr:flagellar basal body-associated FliL family protein [Rhodothermales bacterium]